MENIDFKSKHGNDFKDLVLSKLLVLKNNGLLNKIEAGKRIDNKAGYSQFYVTFYAEGVHNKYAIFTTTSARSDRIKINQWDANGIKLSIGNEIKCILVLPDNLDEVELNNFIKESERIKQDGYISALDHIIKIDELGRVL